MLQVEEWDRFVRRVSELETRALTLRRGGAADEEGQVSVRDAVLEELDATLEALRVAQEELRVEHEQLQEVLARSQADADSWLVDDLPVGVFVTDLDGAIQGLNAAAAMLLGGTPARFGRKPLAAYVDGDRRAFRRAVGAVRRGTEATVAVVLRAPGGSPHPVRLSARRDATGRGTVRWFAVPDPLRGRVPEIVAPVTSAAERLYLALARLALIPIAAAPMAEVLEDIGRIARDAIPTADHITVSTDGVVPAETAGTALPMYAHGELLGQLRVVMPADRSLDASERSRAELYAQSAAAVLANALALAGTRQLADELTHARETRAPIEQAKGILMARRACTADAAFDELRRESQHRNVKLAVVAKSLVEGQEAASAPDGSQPAAG